MGLSCHSRFSSVLATYLRNTGMSFRGSKRCVASAAAGMVMSESRHIVLEQKNGREPAMNAGAIAFESRMHQVGGIQTIDPAEPSDQ